MSELLKGRISDTEGLREVLEIIATFKEVSAAVLEVQSPHVSGKMGIAWGRYITGALLDGSEETGKKALRKMLRLREGKFNFVDAEENPMDDLRQSLGIDLNRVVFVVPDLVYKEAHFLYEFGESPEDEASGGPGDAGILPASNEATGSNADTTSSTLQNSIDAALIQFGVEPATYSGSGWAAPPSPEMPSLPSRQAAEAPRPQLTFHETDEFESDADEPPEAITGEHVPFDLTPVTEPTDVPIPQLMIPKTDVIVQQPGTGTWGEAGSDASDSRNDVAIPEGSALHVMESAVPELAGDFVLPVDTSSEPAFETVPTLDLVFGGPMPEEFAASTPLPSHIDPTKPNDAAPPFDAMPPFQPMSAFEPLNSEPTAASQVSDAPTVSAAASPSPDAPLIRREIPFLRMAQTETDSGTRTGGRSGKKSGRDVESSRVPAPPTAEQVSRQAPTPLLPAGIVAGPRANSNEVTQGAPRLRPRPIGDSDSVGIAIFCVLFFVVSCAGTVVFGPRAWAVITNLLHLSH